MTVVVEFMGVDLKKHQVRLSDYKVAEAGTYNPGSSYEKLLIGLMKESIETRIAVIQDIHYEDDVDE